MPPCAPQGDHRAASLQGRALAVPPSATFHLQMNISRLVGRQAELGVQLRTLPAAGQGLCSGFPLSSKQVHPQGRLRGGSAGGGAGLGVQEGQQSPPRATARPCKLWGRCSSSHWLCSDTGFSCRTAQPPAQQSPGKAGGSSCTSHQHLEMPVAVPWCPKQTRGRDWGSARGAGGCSQLLRPYCQGQDGGTRSGLPNPAVLAHPSSRSRGRMGSSENDSVLLRPLPPQAAVQGAKAAVLLLLLLSKLHKHLEKTENTPPRSF